MRLSLKNSYSGYYVMIHEFSPHIRPCSDSTEPAEDSLCVPHYLSLSKLKFKKWETGFIKKKISLEIIFSIFFCFTSSSHVKWWIEMSFGFWQSFISCWVSSCGDGSQKLHSRACTVQSRIFQMIISPTWEPVTKLKSRQSSHVSH